MKNFLGIEATYSNYYESRFVILPVPFEQTTSYMPGTRQGPSSIIDASNYVELYDDVLGREAYLDGIHTAEPVVSGGDIETQFQQITDCISQLRQDGKFVIALGGEHSISFPLYSAYHRSVKNLSVLQLDAHSDLREQYENSIYSHASVMRRIWELNPDIVQVGIRSQCVEEASFIEENKINTLYAHQIKQQGLNQQIIDKLQDNVYLTIDVDFFDPSIMPSTGTPEPGGFLWDETVAFLTRVFQQRNVVGADVVELSPIQGLVHPDFMTAKLIYRLIGLKSIYDNVSA